MKQQHHEQTDVDYDDNSGAGYMSYEAAVAGHTMQVVLFSLPVLLQHMTLELPSLGRKLSELTQQGEDTTSTHSEYDVSTPTVR